VRCSRGGPSRQQRPDLAGELLDLRPLVAGQREKNDAVGAGAGECSHGGGAVSGRAGDSQVAELEARFAAMHHANELSQMLATAPGIGPIIALTFAIEVDVSAFETGRHLAAWLGLTPQEHSTGGKQRMGGISRAGNERLRSLLVEGAMSVITAVERHGSKLATPWLLAMLARRPRKVVAVALANKMARMIWAMMTRREAYRRPAAAGAGCRPAAVS